MGPPHARNRAAILNRFIMNCKNGYRLAASIACLLVASNQVLAESIATIGVHQWEPDLDGVRSELETSGAGRLARSNRVQPYASMRLPAHNIWLDLVYQHYSGKTASGDFSLGLHHTGLAAGVILDPFKVILEAGGGLEALYLHQKGEVRTRGSSKTFDQIDWGLNGILGLTVEPYPRVGIDFRAIWRWRTRPRIQGRVYDLSGRSLNLGFSLFFRH